MDPPKIEDIEREAKEGILRMEKKVPKARRKKKKILGAPEELWPGETAGLKGGYVLARSKRKAIKKMAGGYT